MYSVGDRVWIAYETADEFNIPKSSTITQIDKNNIQIQDDDNKVEWITQEKIIKHASTFVPIDDMIHLEDLQEYAILQNLHMRYNDLLIYTYIGDMLIAVNPYQVLNIYSKNEVLMYSEKKSEKLPPHIFAISDKSFLAMKHNRQNQCILISGESGAGKTESTKLILHYLTTISAGSAEGHSWIKHQIIEANPILEAFGNAKTQRNNNSSRFGKYINIYFNSNDEIEGARIDYYLLEKSRIVTQSNNERNYHIFYALLAGLSNNEKEHFYLGNAADYAYLNGVASCEEKNDANTFTNIKAAMQVLNYDEEIFSNVLRLLSIILHLGNLKYKETNKDHTDASEIDDDITLKRLSEFFSVEQTILSDVLTKKSIFANGEQIISNLSKKQAYEVRDTLAKIIYEKIFEKIVKEINKTLYNPKSRIKNTIGILDISGFENFDTNSFEQLCINYTNEHLQQFFVQYIFKIEQELYTSEGISWTIIEFTDNQEIINLIGIKSLNIMSLLDEESIFPKGSDASLLSKISLIHGNNNHFVKTKSNLTNEFGIAHFAGTVHYNVNGFLDKNRDAIPVDFKNLIDISTNQFLKRLFSDYEIMINKNSIKRSTTLSMKFQESLESLLKTLHFCNPFFIRCIKPNNDQLSRIFDKELCCKQLRYSGLLDTVKIRRTGYPLRYDYSAFVDRFRALALNIEPPCKSDFKCLTEKICVNVLKESKNYYKLGYTKVFLKDYLVDILEQRRNETLETCALIIQKNFKMWLERKKYLKIKNAVIIIQKVWRSHGPRKKFCKLRKGIFRLQSRIKSRYYETEFQKIRSFIILLQAVCRRYIVQKLYEEKRENIKIKKMQALKNGAFNFNSDNKGILDKRSKESENNIDTIFDFLEDESKNINSRKLSGEIFKDIARKDVSAINSYGILDETDELEITSYDFYKFAAIYFITNVKPHFSKKPLKHSLLDLPHLSDQLAARALSITIFRFMGDLPEPESSSDSYSNKPVMSTITESLSKNLSKTDNYDKFINLQKGYLAKMILKKKNKLNNIIAQGIINDEYENWLNTERSNLDKLHFIIGHGILRPQLKDEIYCQIVKQLIHNPSKSSYAKGWILLSLCIGCFAPSEKFINYLTFFIKSGPADYAPFCEKRLMRTYSNGSRTQPPCWIEMQSVKFNEPILLNINFMDGSVKKIVADAASLAQEIVDSLANTIKLKETFGFSLFISIDDKVMSLGSERDHVMDAISQCEQYAKEQGHLERDASWRLIFRKEIFSPWHNPVTDSVATDLIYHQICKGVKLGEYRCYNENDIAALIAQQLYLHYQLKSLPKNLKAILPSYIPNQFLQENVVLTSSRLEKLIIEVYQKKFRTIEDNQVTKIKEDIVTYAKNSWPMLFAKFYEASIISGQVFDLTKIIIAVNSIGVHFIDDEERIVHQLSYPEILEINYQKNDNTLLHNLSITTIQREEFIFQSIDAENIVCLVNFIIDGLQQRSTFVVAVQDYINNENSEIILSLKKGDIIKLIDDYNGSRIMESSWGFGIKNGIKGKFLCEYVYVLPIIQEPSPQLIELFKSNFVSNTSIPIISEYSENSENSEYSTMKKFANKYFRQNMKAIIRSNSGISLTKNNIFEELWKHTREPIKAPLLAKLSNKTEQFEQAIQIFKNILRYMGDLPSNKQVSPHYTDQIFEPALKDELLRDEVYCQIMRQLTDNKIRLSEERGWELMWLATGIMPCSAAVRKELVQFFNSSNSIVANDCLNRLNKIFKTGTIRKYPPYILEVEAIRFKNLRIFHKVYFPDSTDAAFEVHSSIKAIDLCDEISKKMQLRGPNGFSLFFKIGDRNSSMLMSVPQHYFFFDFIREVFASITHSQLKQSGTKLQIKYQVLFQRKIWIDCLPGRDKNADSKFHFYQEVTKYLQGYHKCSKKDSIELASLIYISGHSNNKEGLSEIHLKLHEYVPADMINLMNSKSWKKHIIAAYNKKKNLSKDQAKEQFLQKVYQWPTFGSNFFDVLQTTESRFPKHIIIAINKNGITIMDRFEKNILVIYSFTDISNWSSDGTHFHMTIGNFINGRKMLCQTALGYKMDDLISSYINYLQNN